MHVTRSWLQKSLVAAALLILSVTFVNLSPPPVAPKGRIEDIRVTFGGLQRRVLLYTPPGLNPARPVPAIFVLHGGFGNADDARSSTAKQFEYLADQQGMIVAYPEAVREPGKSGGHWNDGRALDYFSHRMNVDDVGFIDMLIESAARDFNGQIDMSQIYVAGMSNGAMLSMRLACRLGHRLAGVAAVAGSIPYNLANECMNAKPVSLLMMNGTADTIMRWGERSVYDPFGRPTLGSRATVPESLSFWLGKNGCPSSAYGSVDFANVEAGDGSTVNATFYACSNRTSVAMYTVSGGGHTWPSGGKPSAASGNQNQDINPADEIMGFFLGRSPAPPKTRVLANQYIPGFPHPVDIYRPSNATRALVFLHGGGGTKHSSAHSLGIRTEDSTDYSLAKVDTAWLEANKVMMVFPQGGSVHKASYTWGNHFMKSGRDDVGFLNALAAALRAGGMGFAPVGKVYIGGHSNGGMMANRMWCEAPEAFDAFSAVAGPAARKLNPTGGEFPCRPRVVKPYIGIIGSEDSVLQNYVSKGNWPKTDWFLSKAVILMSTLAPYVDPEPSVVSEEYFHERVRAPLACGQASSPADGVTSGKFTVWSDCNNRVRLVRVNGASHSIVSNLDRTALETAGQFRVRDMLMQYFSGIK